MVSRSFNQELCVICQNINEDDQLIQVHLKVPKTLIEYCEIRKHKDLENNLKEQEASEKEHVLVHKNRRRDFTNSRRSTDTIQHKKDIQENSIDEITLRSACRNNFNWNKNCFYCGEELIKDKKHSDRNKSICKSSELESKNTVIRKCKDEEINGQRKFQETLT